MGFVHPLLLGGLLLVGVPVLIHLIMQQKPKHLPFPAFRFLLQKHRTNQRRLRLRHLLLLALRIVLVAAICLALARPKLFSNRLGIGSDRPVAAVLLFDTSYSMEYRVAQQTRLDEAKKRALELLEVLPAESRIAILDSAEPGGEWLVSRAQAEDRIAGLKLRPINAPVTRQIGQAYKLLNELDREQSDQSEDLPRFLYVFSDRTTACWDSSEAKALHPPEGLNSIFVDVGVDNPADLAITGVELPRQIVHPGFEMEMRIGVQAVGIDGDNELLVRTGEEKAERKPIQFAAGKSEVKVRRDAGLADSSGSRERLLPPGFHQFAIQFGSSDALPSNNVAYATIKVQEGRRILVVTDHPGKRAEDGDAALWFRALMASHVFPCNVCSPDDFANFALGELKRSYEAICLLNVANPSEQLWEKVTAYVEAGKGLAVVPGGEDWLPSLKAYNLPLARKLLGVQFLQSEGPLDKPVSWNELEADADKAALHPIVKRFRDAKDEERFNEETMPGAFHYWKVKPEDAKARVIASYVDDAGSPALVEKQHGKAHVLTFTTSMDNRLVRNRHANNYFAPGSWFGVGLVVFSTGYLAGDAETPNFNFICGQTVTVPVPATPTALFRLFGPGITDSNVPRGKGENEVRITQAVLPGNYMLFDPSDGPHDPKPVACFSLNVSPEECQLDRVPVEQIEALLGPGSVWSIERGLTLGDALQGRWLQPLELFPWLMIVVLLVLAVENLLANKFYRRAAQEEAPPHLAAALGAALRSRPPANAAQPTETSGVAS